VIFNSDRCALVQSLQRAAVVAREAVLHLCTNGSLYILVTYVRQLMRTNRIDQAAFDALKKRHNAQWLVELTAAANYFALLSGVVNAFEVAAPADGDKLPV